ncbi:hypothetical protein [Streptomyces sp. NPDC051546]|uniref:hypothetical protein n=1 Tax=Streptomyces sp. NPDC051546 TaxID=3365655 RepID=UPI00379E3FA3
MTTWQTIFYDAFAAVSPNWLNVTTTGGSAVRPTIVDGHLQADSYTVLENRNYAYDPDSLYRVTAVVASGASSPQGYFYLGVTGVQADGTTRVSTAGTDTVAQAHYFAASRKTTPLGEWATFTGYFMGQSTAAGGEHPDIGDPGTVRPEAAYVRPLMYLGYQVIAPDKSISMVKSFRLEILRDAAHRVQLIAGGLRAWTEIQAWPTKTYDRTYSVLNVVGRRDPVVLTDVLRQPTSTVTFLTRTATDRRDLLAVLGASVPVQLLSPCPDVEPVWFMPLKATPNRLTGSGTDPRRLWEVEIQEVAAP